MLGTVSLATFGVAALWAGLCALGIHHLLPSEAALPVFGLLYFGVLGLTAFGVLCALLGVLLTPVRRWVALAGLVLNGSPWLYLAWIIARDRLL